MLKYKDFFRELIAEANEEGVSLRCDATFDRLPESPPYGFLILPDGKFGVARNAWDHEELAGSEYNHSPWKVMQRGGARIVKNENMDEYLVVCFTSRIKPQVKRLAMDLAKYYGLDFSLKDDSKWEIELEEGKLHEEAKICTDFTDLPHAPPYGFLVFPDGKFVVASGMFTHNKLAGPKYHYDSDHVLEQGGARMVVIRPDRVYHSDLVSSKTSRTVTKLVSDLSKYYGYDAEMHDRSSWFNIKPDSVSPETLKEFYRDSYSDLLAESSYDIDSFEDLPERAPYGFIVFPDGTFNVAFEMCDHSRLSRQAGYDCTNDVIKAGGLRIAEAGRGDYEGYYLQKKANREAQKTAKDLATYYGYDLDLTDVSSWIGGVGQPYTAG